MRPQNPFEALINQFLSIPQTIQQGIVRRDEQVRSDRIRDEQRQQQLADEARRREQQLTDVALSERQRQIERIQQDMIFTTPGSPEYERARAAIEQLSQPLQATGQEALNRVIQGDLMFPRTVEGMRERRPGPDGEPVQTSEDRVVQEPGNVNTLIADLGAARRDAELEQRTAEILFQESLDYLSDTQVDPQQRVFHLNNAVLKNDLFTDQQKQALAIAAGMRDDDARKLVEQQLKANENQLTLQTIEISTARTRQAREELQLEQDQRLADLTYQEAEERVRRAIADGRLQDLEAFLKYGVLPSDASRAEDMAARLGVESVEELQAQGQARYARLQERDQIELELARQSKELGALQIDQAELAKQTAEYNLNRLEGFGVIQDATQLATTAFAAAANGDIATLTMLEGMANDPKFSSQLRNLNFEDLKSKAQRVIGDEEAAREFTREQNAALLAQYRRGALVDAATLANAVGGRMVHLPEDQIVEEVDRFIGTLTKAELEALGGEEAFRASLLSEARFQRREMQREVGGLTVDMLSKAVPGPNEDGTRSAEQNEWRDDFVLAAADAGLDPELADSIAEGLLSGTDLTYWEARLRKRQLELQIDELEKKLNDEGVDLDTIKVLLSAEQDRSLNASRIVSSQRCSVPNPAGGETFNANDPSCLEAYVTFQDAERRMKLLSDMLMPTDLRAALEEGDREAVEEATTESLRQLWSNIAATGDRAEIAAARAQALELEEVAGNEERMEILNTILPMPEPVSPGEVGLRGVATSIAEGAGNIGPTINQGFNRLIHNQPTDGDLRVIQATEEWGSAVGRFAATGEMPMELVNRISSKTGLNTGLIQNAVRNFVSKTQFGR